MSTEQATAQPLLRAIDLKKHYPVKKGIFGQERLVKAQALTHPTNLLQIAHEKLFMISFLRGISTSHLMIKINPFPG